MSLRARILYPSVTPDKAKAAALLAGKTILITGASFGIGEALTRHLLGYDVKLILVARTTEKLLALKEESVIHKAEVTAIHCDLYDEESIAALGDKLKTLHIDYFVSNAGKSLMRSFGESLSRPDDYRKTVAVNYLAPVQLIMILSESFTKARTHIINVSTYNVLMKTPPKWSAYVSAKKAMHSWVQSNTPELAAMNITISNVYLPLVESRMKEANRHYGNTPAMSMSTAVAVIVKGLLIKNYHYTPWWHVPFQVLLFLGGPLWDVYWHMHFRNKE